MRIRLNGAPRETPAATVAELVAELTLPAERLWVELNGKTVRRADWAAAPLRDGDAVELVHFVGGG